MASLRLRFWPFDRLLDPGASGPAQDGSSFDCALEREMLKEPGVRYRGETLPLRKAQLFERFARRDRLGDRLPGDPVRLPKRNASSRQVIGRLRGQRVTTQ